MKINVNGININYRIDGLESPVDLVAEMTIGETGIDVDFTGTSGISSYGINVPMCYTEAYASFGVKCIAAPESSGCRHPNRRDRVRCSEPATLAAGPIPRASACGSP